MNLSGKTFAVITVCIVIATGSVTYLFSGLNNKMVITTTKNITETVVSTSLLTQTFTQTVKVKNLSPCSNFTNGYHVKNATFSRDAIERLKQEVLYTKNITDVANFTKFVEPLNSRNFGNSGPIEFDFRIPKLPYFNSEMYGGDPNNST